MRFGMRELLLTVSCIGLLLALVIRWWTLPYALTGSHPNGACAWEQWERRTVTMTIVHVKTVRYYRNGQKAYEFEAGGKSQCWSPRGQSVSENECLADLWDDGLAEVTDDQSTRPFQSLIWWWNGW